MSELTLTLIRFAYLAILWIFVLAAISVVRSDMFGARVEQSPRAERRAQKEAQKQAQKQAQQQAPRKRRTRGAPTRVVIVDGSNAGESVPLDGAPLLIGRGPDAAIRLDDDYVSTRHARIAASGEQWFVEDLGSTNGTYLGPRRLTQPAVVQTGSQIRIGKTTLELKK
jgi:pSer/pThr/pTyr-binding forkhead associated (FHA) protein